MTVNPFVTNQDLDVVALRTAFGVFPSGSSRWRPRWTVSSSGWRRARSRR